MSTLSCIPPVRLARQLTTRVARVSGGGFSNARFMCSGFVTSPNFTTAGLRRCSVSEAVRLDDTPARGRAKAVTR